jgi:LmbE family N-acetylglucosaminyl deacetylase
MLPVLFPARAPLRVLALGAHADDIEIGCGATMLSLVQEGSVELTWVVFATGEAREAEARSSFASFAEGAATARIDCHAFRDGYFPYSGAEVKDVFESLKTSSNPDVIFTHARHDRHQDHRVISDLTWNTWRDHLVLEYEIPKYDGDLTSPNVYVGVDAEHARRKVELLESHFATQRDKHWFDEELFLGRMRGRGAESRASSGFAEAFFGHKVSIGVTA